MKNKKNIILLIVILLTTFISFYILNVYTPFTSDDFSFLYEYKGTHLTTGIKRVTNLSQLFPSMKNLYLYVNGRIVPHFLLQFLLIFPKYIFNFFNSIMFVFLGILIYKVGTKEKIKNFKPLTLLLIYSLMYLFLPSFGMTTLWCSGSLNYLWITTFSLSFFLYFEKSLEKDKNSVLDYIFLFLLSVMACNGIESASFAVLFFTLGSSVIYLIKNRKLKLCMLISVLGNSLGIYLLLTAASLSTREIIPSYFNIVSIIKRAGETKGLLDFYLYIFIAVFIILIINLFKHYKKQESWNISLYYATGIVSYFPLLLAPYVADRAFFLSYTILISSIIFIYNKLKNQYIKFILVGIIFSITLYIYFSTCYKDVKISHNEFNKIETIIEESKEKNITNVIVPNYFKRYSKYPAFYNEYTFLSDSEKDWINEWIAFHYGIESIRIED